MDLLDSFEVQLPLEHTFAELKVRKVDHEDTRIAWVKID
jgi:hypothetical protein